MKFGIEIEKFLFDLKHNCPSEGVFCFIDALTDLELYEDTDPIKHVTNEFVLNLIEMTTQASHRPREVLKGYLQNYLLLKSVARRESATLVPMGSMPMPYQPRMTPKWSYFVQNSILDSKIQSSWVMNESSPLTAAGNCAGVHIHIEVETPPEYLFSNRELMDKFNLALMLTPMIAFASSPYFFGRHWANSMRGENYFYGVYKNFPHQGGLPPVMKSSEEVLLFFRESIQAWVKRGVEIGLPEDDLNRLTSKKGASWNPIRWNKQWNTIELRCLDSDRTDLDFAKFIWVCGALKRADLKGEALQTIIIPDLKLSHKLIQECFQVENGKVKILSSQIIKELFDRAIRYGLKDELVHSYLKKIGEFAKSGVEPENESLFEVLWSALDKKETTSDILLEKVSGADTISNESATELVNLAIENEQNVLNSITKLID